MYPRPPLRPMHPPPPPPRHNKTYPSLSASRPRRQSRIFYPLLGLRLYRGPGVVIAIMMMRHPLLPPHHYRVENMCFNLIQKITMKLILFRCYNLCLILSRSSQSQERGKQRAESIQNNAHDKHENSTRYSGRAPATSSRYTQAFCFLCRGDYP